MMKTKNFDSYSKKMQKVEKMILKSASTDANILIIGDKGVGKNYCAIKIHQNSNRAKENIVEINSSELKNKDSLLNSIVNAYNGTLFVDEITQLSHEFQSLILDYISISPQPFRLIAASTGNIEPFVRSGKLREELYNRLCVFKIKLPSLKDRKEDIPYLIDYFLNELNMVHGKEKVVSEDFIKTLSNKKWTENIAELEETIKKAYLNSEISTITLDDIPYDESRDEISDQLYDITVKLISKSMTDNINMVFEEYKKVVMPPFLRAALVSTSNNKSKAADILGINRNTLNKLIKEYNIED